MCAAAGPGAGGRQELRESAHPSDIVGPRQINCLPCLLPSEESLRGCGGRRWGAQAPDDRRGGMSCSCSRLQRAPGCSGDGLGQQEAGAGAPPALMRWADHGRSRAGPNGAAQLLHPAPPSISPISRAQPIHPIANPACWPRPGLQPSLPAQPDPPANPEHLGAA